MRPLVAAAPLVAALLASGGITACSFVAGAADMRAGDCLRFVGPVDVPEVEKVACGSDESSYKVVETVANSEECPADVDSYFSLTSGDITKTVCMDVDWVVGECMAIDPEGDSDPTRVYCYDSSVDDKQRASEILDGVADVDQCRSGVGYAYEERRFTVCVDDMP